jgi:hypothetical protein
MMAGNFMFRFFRRRKNNDAVFNFFAMSPLRESRRSRMKNGSFNDACKNEADPRNELHSRLALVRLFCVAA